MVGAMRYLFCALALCTTNAVAKRTPEPPAPSSTALTQLDEFTRELAAADKFSGVVLVARGGTILSEKAYGRIDPHGTAPATVDTRYNIASAGKMFTSTAILQLVAARKLTLDTKVGAVLVGYPNRAFADAVTIRQLLTHTAGAGDIDLFDAEGAANRAKVNSVADMVALHSSRAPEFTPGTKQSYGNFGFVVLGRIVEILSGERYEDYVTRHIFRPASMTRTSFAECTDPAPDIARGYVTVASKEVLNCATIPARGFPAGGEVSTVRDLYRFVRALQAGRLIPRPLFAEATRTHEQFMGLGFFATDYGPETPLRDFRWGHGGSADAISSEVRVYTRTGEIIIALSNRSPPVIFDVTGYLHRQYALAHPDLPLGTKP